MELTYLLLTGSLSGLVSTLAHSVAGSAIEFFRPPVSTVDGSLATLQISEALLHMLCGIGLGLMFWLSWGLAAIVDVSWWVRGLSFGSLCWLTLALPSVISISLARGIPLNAATVIASRWATTCLIAGLACAWSWESGTM